MKGLILSGGHGTRLRPLTFTRAKQLIPVANKPVLFYALEALQKAEIRDIGIVVGSTQDEIRAAVGDGDRWGARVTYIPQEAPLGLAHAVKISADFLAGSPFVMYLGDNLLRDGITGFVDAFRDTEANALILLTPVRNPWAFGVAVLEGTRVVRLVEKPKDPPSNLALVGVYLFDHTIQEAVSAITPSGRGELEITDAIQYLLDRGYRVDAHMVTGWWKDTGRPEDILEANSLILEALEPSIRGSVDGTSRLEGRVVLEEGSRVEESVIRGPAIIGRHSRISHSYIGPFTSIGDHVTVEHSEVEHCVLLEHATVSGLDARLQDSLIGTHVQVSRANGRPKAFKLFLGDASRVEVL